MKNIQVVVTRWDINLPVLVRDSLLLAFGHPADCVQEPGYCETLQHQHAQVQASLCKHPALACNRLLLTLGHPADIVQGPGYCQTLGHQHAQVRAFSGKHSKLARNSLLPV